MGNNEPLHLNVNTDDVHTRDDYLAVWARHPEVEATVIRQDDGCKHEIGDTFTYKTHRDRPEGICTSADHVFQPYLWRVAMGFPRCPPWGPEDRSVYHVHCPAPNGTVWELRRKDPSSQPEARQASSEAAPSASPEEPSS
jgi:uncharacterized repeat protein (TIGR04076 family)